MRIVSAIVLSACIGVAWGGLALVLIPPSFPYHPWPAALSAPLVGVGIGLASLPLARARLLVRIVTCLVSIHLAAAVLGLIMTAISGDLLIRERAYSTVMSMWLGLTTTGLLVMLWPLSVASHELLWFVARRGSAPSLPQMPPSERDA